MNDDIDEVEETSEEYLAPVIDLAEYKRTEFWSDPCWSEPLDEWCH